MTSNTADSRARRRLPAAAVVLLLHLGLFGGVSLALLHSRSSLDRDPAPAAPMAWLRLLPPPQAARIDAPALPPALPRRSLPVPRERPEAVLNWAPGVPSAPSTAPATAPAAAPTEPGQPAAAIGPPAQAPAASRPLVLTLPRGAAAPWRNPALDDPRSNTQAATLENRLATVMASSEGPITQEHMPDGSVRFRRGKSCVVVRPSRSGTLDPFNQSVSPKPRQVDSC